MSKDIDELSGTPTQEISAFYYTAADHNILLENDIKTEVVEQLTIFPMPHAPSWCSGMISLRGKIIPVLDMAYVLGAPTQADARWLLILESAPLPQVAIKITSLPARLSYKEDQVDVMEKGKQPNWLIESVKTDDLNLFKADHSLLFNQLINENLTNQATQTSSKQEPSEEEV